ncbi:PREDICTED: protein FAM111A [Elephantulus edwardii]|uniref:protein FAM111A n=1 Tax=Elephantulus edwardii TaxID=28737 RepID=UPI0003F0DB2A|nr:PREDICTED: protein FAM111A [Elephantulus edwardii]
MVKPKNRRSLKIPFNEKKYGKMENYFPLVAKDQENNCNTPQMKKGSTKSLRDITNFEAQKAHCTQENPKDQALKPQHKTISITLDLNCRNNDRRKYMLTYNERESLYVALNTADVVKKEIKSQRGKMMLVCGREKLEGYINLGMPLSCLPEMSHLVITFIAGKQTLRRCDERVSTDCVKFYINTIGKGRKKIIRYMMLHKKGLKFCVYAFKGETIKEALCKDGRFLPILENHVWRLVENSHSVIENGQRVDDLEGKSFDIEFEVEKRMSPRIADSQNSESEQRPVQTLNMYLVDQYPSLKQESEKIRECFNREMKDRKKKGNLFNIHKENFGKLVSNSTTMKEHKDFSHYGQSVGYMCWDNNGNQGCGTCFVFKGLYILTCRHVINLIVGEGIETGQWANIISQCLKVTFDYEENVEQSKKYFTVDPWLEVSDETLDYAVLKLKENGQQVPPGLYTGLHPVPLNGLLRIIGHPEGKVKSTDNCLVIPLNQRKEKCQAHIQARQAEGYDCSPYVHMQTEKSFREIIDNPTVITYDTSFFFGSSGSPVFDSKFSLVAMHTAGFSYQYQNGCSSVIEFGITMEVILDHMKENHRQWYEEVGLDQLDAEMVSDED